MPEKIDNKRIEDKKNRLINLSRIEKLKYVDRLVVRYPLLKKIHNSMEECILSPQYSDLPECISIYGPPRSGKTTIIKKFMEKYPDKVGDEGQVKQIVYCEVPCPATISSLPTALLYALGDPFYNKSQNIATKTLRLEKLLIDCKVKMIILDEVQHLIDGNKKSLLYNSSDWFKNLITQTRIPVVFSGLEYSTLIFESNVQLGARVLNRYSIKPFKYNDNDFKGILFFLDKELPLKEASNLANTDTWKYIYEATEGYLGYLKILLKESVRIAIDNNYDYITMPILAEAFNNKLSSIINDNPFMPGYRLNQKKLS